MKNCFVKSKVWDLIFDIFSLKKMLEIPENTNMLIFFVIVTRKMMKKMMN